jgi:hypothetical protein
LASACDSGNLEIGRTVFGIIQHAAKMAAPEKATS